MREAQMIDIECDESGDFFSDPFSPVNSVIGVTASYEGDATSVALVLQGGFPREGDETVYVDLDYVISLSAANTPAGMATGDGTPSLFAQFPHYRIKATVDDAADIKLYAVSF